MNDNIAEGYLPAKIQRSLHRRICTIERLPADLLPGALVTPDGVWHDSADAGTDWAGRYQELIAAHLYCWVVEFRAHA